MAPPSQSFTRWSREHPNHLGALGVAVLMIATSLWVGAKARTASRELGPRRAAWEQVANQLATVQQQFRAPTSKESAGLIVESARMGTLGVTPADELSLIESIGRLAEACALTQIRANSSQWADSLFLPARSIGRQNLKPATFVVTLEFSGSFAGLVQFVSSLPPSVSVSQLGAGRRGGSTTYHLVLSVYELDGNSAG